MLNILKKENKNFISVREQEQLDNKQNPLTKEQKLLLYKGEGKIRSYSTFNQISYNSQDQYWATLDDYFFIMVKEWINETKGVTFDHINKIMKSTKDEIGVDLLNNLGHQGMVQEIKSQLKIEEILSNVRETLNKL